MQRDVDEGREHLNYSEWNRPQEGGEVAESVREGSMPPRFYLLTHPDARLTDAEIAALVAGFTATIGAAVDVDGEGGEDDD
jgi:hypothetical protein